MSTHNLITCPECNGNGGHVEVLDHSTRQQTGVMCEECCGAGKVLTTADTLPATVDSSEFVNVVSSYANKPTIDNAINILRHCDNKLRESVAATYLLARQEGYDQAIQDDATCLPSTVTPEILDAIKMSRFRTCDSKGDVQDIWNLLLDAIKSSPTKS